MIKSLRGALGTGDATAATKLLSTTVASIDRAVTKGVLEKNTANRYKSRLTLACNALQANRAPRKVPNSRSPSRSFSLLAGFGPGYRCLRRCKLRDHELHHCPVVCRASF